MSDKDPAPTFDATGDPAAQEQRAGDPGGGDRAADAAETLADRRARAARIRERSLELIEALGADHPLVAEALARADALDRVTMGRTEASAHPARGASDDGDAEADAGAGTIDLCSSADLPH